MYRAAYHWASRIAHRVPLPRGPLRDALAGRQRAGDRWVHWARSHRPAGPLVWVHAASVGEAVAASSVVTRLQSAVDGLAVVHSFTSPSVVGWRPSFTRVHADYLPRDEPHTTAAALEAVRPDLVLFSRGDLWPEFIRQCHARTIPVAVMGAEVSPTSRRLSQAGRFLYARVLSSVSWIGAVSEADAARWCRIGAQRASVVVTGDPRHDAVLDRIPDLGTVGGLREWGDGHPVIVGASLEPSDEQVFCRAVLAARVARPEARFLFVPHAISEDGVSRLRGCGAAIGIEIEPWSHAGHTPTANAVVVTVRGVLFDLYTLAEAVYVGGGFRRNGLHAVIEPAAYGIPIAVGPRYGTSRDAVALLEAGGGVALPRRGAVEALAASWRKWIADPDGRRSTGLAARSTVRAGAAAATVEHLVRVAGPPTLEAIHHPRSAPNEGSNRRGRRAVSVPRHDPRPGADG